MKRLFAFAIFVAYFGLLCSTNQELRSEINNPDNPISAIDISAQTITEKVQKFTTIKRTISVTNPNEHTVTARFLIDEPNSIIPNGWDVELLSSKVEIPPGETRQIEVKMRTDGQVAYSNISVCAIIDQNNGSSPIISDMNIAYLSSDAKYAIFNTYLSMYAPEFYQMAMMQTNYADKAVYLPFTPEYAATYSPDDFEVAFFMFTTPWDDVAFLMPFHLTFINAMISKGKHVYIASDISGLVAYTTDAPDSVKDPIKNFFANVLKVQYGGTKQRITTQTSGSSTQITINSFVVNGMEGDVIGGNFGTMYNQTNEHYASYTDYLTIPAGSPAQRVCYYDGNHEETAGVRVQTNSGSKVVYLSFPLEATTNFPMHRVMINNVMKWFVGEIINYQPEIVADVSTLRFDQVDVGSHKDMKIELENIGNATLEITKVEVEFDADGVFSVLDDEPASLEPGETKTYTIRFAPKDEKLYTFAEVVVYNNDPIYSEYAIGLEGSGKLPQASGPRARISEEELFFGTVLIDDFNIQKFTVTNTGGENLVLSNFLIENNADGCYSIISPNPEPIAPTRSFEIAIRFAPKAKKDYNSTFKFTTNDKDNPVFEIPLVGKGYDLSSVADGIYGRSDIFTISAGPNPLSSTTQFKYNVAGNLPKDVSISIIDSRGSLIALLVNGTIAPGDHQLTFDGTTLPVGSYFVVAKVGKFSTALPIAIIR